MYIVRKSLRIGGQKKKKQKKKRKIQVKIPLKLGQEKVCPHASAWKIIALKGIGDEQQIRLPSYHTKIKFWMYLEIMYSNKIVREGDILFMMRQFCNSYDEMPRHFSLFQHTICCWQIVRFKSWSENKSYIVKVLVIEKIIQIHNKGTHRLRLTLQATLWKETGNFFVEWRRTKLITYKAH